MAPWIVLCVFFISLWLMAFRGIRSDYVLLTAAGLLTISGVLSPEQTLQGLSHPAVVAIALFYVIAAGLKESGAIAWLGPRLMGRGHNVRAIQLRLLPLAALFSAFMNNTPVVSTLTTVIQHRCRHSALSPSRFLLPLSYISILAGTCTLIGSSTNVLLDGLLKQVGLDGIGLFELAGLGVPLLFTGMIYILFLSPRLLKGGQGAIEHFDNVRQYSVEMLVTKDCELAGQTILQAGLRNLPGLFLAEIDRDSEILTVVEPHTRILAGDRLLFVGEVDSVVSLQQIHGLQIASDQRFKLQDPAHDRRLFEAVLSPSNPMVGQTIKQARLRHRYQAVVFSIARDGRQLGGKLGDIKLRAGDTLLLEAAKGFLYKFRNHRDFLLVSRLDSSVPVHSGKAKQAFAYLALLLLLLGSGWMSLLPAAMLVAGLMLVSRCIEPDDARKAVDFRVLGTLVGALALGQAFVSSGVAGMLADAMQSISSNSVMVGLVMTYLLTLCLTELISNGASAVIMFPVALSLAEHYGVSVRPFAMTVLISASASFISPIGYQTNLMVQGPGGYRFSDYLRFGLPLSFLVALISLLLIPKIWPL